MLVSGTFTSEFFVSLHRCKQQIFVILISVPTDTFVGKQSGILIEINLIWLLQGFGMNGVCVQREIEMIDSMWKYYLIFSISFLWFNFMFENIIILVLFTSRRRLKAKSNLVPFEGKLSNFQGKPYFYP